MSSAFLAGPEGGWVNGQTIRVNTHDGTTMLVTRRSAGVERMQQLLVGGAGLGHTFESMSKPTYPVARQVAEKVHRYFTEHLTSQPRLEPSNAAPTPDVEALEYKHIVLKPGVVAPRESAASNES